MKAKVETSFIVTSSEGISMTVPRNEIGMPRLTQTASRSSRNSASIRNTSANPARPLRPMIDSRPCMYSAWFCHTVSAMPSGRVGLTRST